VMMFQHRHEQALALAERSVSLHEAHGSGHGLAVALATHYVLGIVFGLVLATVIVGFHYETSAGMLQLFGVVFGAALYLLNFHAMAALFPWFADLRGWATFIAHLVFGLTVVLTYMRLQPRRVDQ